MGLLLVGWLAIGYSNRFLGICCIFVLFTSSFDVFSILVKWLSNQSQAVKWLYVILNQARDGVVNFLVKYPPVPAGILGSLIFGSIGLLCSRYFWGPGMPQTTSGEKEIHSNSDTYPADVVTQIKLASTLFFVMCSVCIAIHVLMYLVASLIFDWKRHVFYTTCISSTTYLSASCSLYSLFTCLLKSYFQKKVKYSQCLSQMTH